MKTPLMLDTKRMAIHDGPGVRTTFFVKGCLLKCLWCHNPESLSPAPQLARFKHKCKHCAKCTMNETICPGGALKLYGKPATIPELVAKALEDKQFYEATGGGVTLSGGEPLLFWEWAAEFFAALKAVGLSTALDTSLYAPPAAIERLLPLTDVWLPDFKAFDSGLHQRLCRVRNGPIKQNLEYLVSKKVKLEVRIPVVPGCNNAPDEMRRIDGYLASLGIKNIVKLEYHDYARSKYEALGMQDSMPPLR